MQLLLLTALAAAPVQAAPLDPRLQALLDDPATTFKADKVPGGFEAITWSLLAEACAARHDEIGRDCLSRAAAHSTTRTPYDLPLDEVKSLGNHGLFMAHTALVLLAYEEETGDPAYTQTLDRLTARLRALSLADPHAHAPSYPSAAQRWPADQTVVLAALARYDRDRDTDLLAEPLARWKAEMARHTDPRTGLFQSEVTGIDKSSRTPRGCAASWSVRYLATFDPALAHEQWDHEIASLSAALGPFGGLREYPVGRGFPSDADSGPIIAGVGAAATAFGIGAARAMGDHSWELALRSTEEAGWLAVKGNAEIEAAANSVLAHAIAAAMHATPKAED